MLGSICVGFAGMTAYSRGLNVISNNVANMNTPGFKVGDPLFSNLVYRGDGGAVSGFGGTRSNGAGVAVNTDRMSFRQGDFADQGNSLDAAIDGNGFFVLEQSGRLAYTRAGQFELDDDGFLVHRATGDKVMVTGDALAHSTFNVEDYRVFAPAATTEVALGGNLARTVGATYLLSDINMLIANFGATTRTTRLDDGGRGQQRPQSLEIQLGQRHARNSVTVSWLKTTRICPRSTKGEVRRGRYVFGRLSMPDDTNSLAGAPRDGFGSATSAGGLRIGATFSSVLERRKEALATPYRAVRRPRASRHRRRKHHSMAALAGARHRIPE
jgi:flagellar hook-basal body protein